MVSTIDTTQPETIARRLDPHAIPMDKVKREYGLFVQMVTNLLGAPPETYSYLSLNPVTQRVYFAMQGLSQSDAVDAGQSTLTPDLRKRIMLGSSQTYQCDYCSAHAAGMGSAFSGPFSPTEKTTETELSLVVDPMDQRLDQVTRDVLRLILSTSQMPSVVTDEMRKKVAGHLGPEGMLIAAMSASMMGWLNTCMDSLGANLERHFVDLASKHLDGWTPGKHARPDSELTTGTVQSQPQTNSAGPPTMEQMMQMKQAIMGQIGSWLHTTKTPLTPNHGPPDWLNYFKENMGFIPMYFQAAMAVPQSLMFWILLMRNYLFRDLDEAKEGAASEPILEGATQEWSTDDKALLLFAYFRLIQNDMMATHFGYLLSQKRQVPASRVNAVVAAAEKAFKSPHIAMVEGENDKRLNAAVTYVSQIAQTPTKITGTVSDALVRNCQSPSGVIEIISTLSLGQALHRFSNVMLPPGTSEFEPEVQQWLATDAAKEMGMKDCSRVSTALPAC